MTSALRAFSDDDADLVFRLHNDEELARIVPFVMHHNIAQSREALARIRAQEKALTSRGFVITVNGAAAGTVGLVRIDRDKRVADLAYQLLREHWGTGVAREAVTTVLALGFGELALERVFARVDSLNVRSWRFAEKLGFTRAETYPETFEGELRTTYRYVRHAM